MSLTRKTCFPEHDGASHCQQVLFLRAHCVVLSWCRELKDSKDEFVSMFAAVSCVPGQHQS